MEEKRLISIPSSNLDTDISPSVFSPLSFPISLFYQSALLGPRRTSMSSSKRRALLSIEFIIVGAGVAGLATALRLCQAGHRVRILDKALGPNRRAGGTHLPPNATKVLVDWGFKDQLLKHALSTRASKFISIDTGEVIGCLEWKEDVLQETGADYMVISYRDLYDMLYREAIAAGARISFNTPVAKVHANPPRVQLQDGTVLKADMIIGADGPRSTVREAVVGWPSEEVPEGHSAYVAIIPRDVLQNDPELSDLTQFHEDRPDYPIWTGDSRHVIAFTVAGGTEFAIHAFLPDSEVDGIGDEDGWDVIVPRERLPFHFEPKLQRLLDIPATYQRVRLFQRECAEEWTDESGRLLLMGEAAHPLYPCVLQSCSMQIEDAEVLGTLFSRLRAWDQLPHLAEAFQELREPRTRAIYAKETKAFDLVWVPPGPQRDARDQALYSMMVEGHKGWDETKMRWQWDEICEVFGYNARDAAEDWWVMWGMLRERSITRDGHCPSSYAVPFCMGSTVTHYAEPVVLRN
ncbi:hypothetical protein DEU56DRAFT_788922 [Suillus clintonianus]|uniref:uncharacterized protein n=1 Tax=Suillus clintonianus TaxID=1904413 RepID=UPI001B8725CF|nr:uncharacterized protein DEU56DRAFT_788922 [Suillus clintonianus]KAG2145125.1 hypothetical protein DEU56DRAFT_788922 [Suillus clintonianus]